MPTASNPTLRLRTFGAVAIESNGRVRAGLGTGRKPLALLSLLAAAGEAGVSRDKLVAYLWSESDDEQARNALSQLLFRTRQELGADAVEGSDDLRLNPAIISSDVGDFKTLIAAGRDADAVELYAGPFLDGFHLRNAPEFQRWMDNEQRRLADACAAALERLALAASNAGDALAAVECWKRLAELEPLSARIARAYADALSAAGDRERAVRHIERYAALVRSELETEPDPTLIALAASLRAAPSRAEAAPAATPLRPPASADLQPMATRETRLRLRIRRGAWVPLLAIAALGLAAFAGRQPQSDLVRVTSFESSGGDGADAVQSSTMRSVVSILQQTGRLRVVLDEGAFAHDDDRARCLVAMFATRCRAEFVVTGAVRRVGDSIGVFPTIIHRGFDTPPRALPPVVRAASDGYNITADASSEIAGAIAAVSDKRLTELAGAGRLPRYEAYVHYARAIDAMFREDSPTPELRAAADADSTFAQPWLMMLDEPSGQAREAAGKWLASHRILLSERDQALADALVQRNRGDNYWWLMTARRLLDVSPHDPWALRRFARAAYASNYYADALAAIREARRYPSWEGELDDAWMFEIDALHGAGDFDAAIRLWREKARERQPDDQTVCVTGVLQLAAAGEAAAVDSLITRCSTEPANGNRLGHRVSSADELFRRAGRELLWHGHGEPGRRALRHAYLLERQLYAMDSTANNGWLAKDLLRDWRAAYDLMRADFAADYLGAPPCGPRDRRRICLPRNRLRFAVDAAHVGDTAPALLTLREIDAARHSDSLYKVERAKILLALGRRDAALVSLSDAARSLPPGTWMHANTELLELRGDPAFEALIAPRRTASHREHQGFVKVKRNDIR